MAEAWKLFVALWPGLLFMALLFAWLIYVNRLAHAHYNDPHKRR